jgi:hypothetical protein
MLRSRLKINRRFGGTCRLNLHGRKTRQARNLWVESSARADFLLGLFIDLEE